MLTYQICKPKVQRDGVSIRDKTLILSNALRRSTFRIGDKVRFKKPKRNPNYGHIVDIITDESKIAWTHGGICPLNIIVEVVKTDPANGVYYGTQKIATSAKKLLLLEAARV